MQSVTCMIIEKGLIYDERKSLIVRVDKETLRIDLRIL